MQPALCHRPAVATVGRGPFLYIYIYPKAIMERMLLNCCSQLLWFVIFLTIVKI